MKNDNKRLFFIKSFYVVIFWSEFNDGYMFEIFDNRNESLIFLNEETLEYISGIDGGLCTSHDIKDAVVLAEKIIDDMNKKIDTTISIIKPKKKWWDFIFKGI